MDSNSWRILFVLLSSISSNLVAFTVTIRVQLKIWSAFFIVSRKVILSLRISRKASGCFTATCYYPFICIKMTFLPPIVKSKYAFLQQALYSFAITDIMLISHYNYVLHFFFLFMSQLTGYVYFWFRHKQNYRHISIRVL